MIFLLGLYDMFAGIALLANLRIFLIPVFIFSTLKGIYTIAASIDSLSGTFFIMGVIDLFVGVISLLLLFQIIFWFYWIVAALVLAKGFFSII